MVGVVRSKQANLATDLCHLTTYDIIYLLESRVVHRGSPFLLGVLYGNSHLQERT